MKLLSVLALFFAFSLSACAPVEALNALVPKEGYALKDGIAYGKDPAQKLDLYLPDRISPNTPVVVFFHGGSWQGGKRQDYLFLGQSFASLGYITVIPDYRTYPEVSYPEFLRDNARAVVWTYKHIKDYGGNSENLYLTGHSAGAYNAVMLALNQSYLEAAGGKAGWIRGVVGLAGPYDFLPFTDPNIIALFGTEKNSSRTQPITYARAKAPPMLLATGTGDEDVDPGNSKRLADKLKSLGNDVTYREYPGMGHLGIIRSLSNTVLGNDEVKRDIARFIETH